MDFMKNIPVLETMVGSGTDSTYVVIARKEGYKLGLKPTVFLKSANQNVYMGVRVRANTAWAEQLGLSFGKISNGLRAKGTTHSSGIICTRVSPEPISGTEANRIIKEYNLLDGMVQHIFSEIGSKSKLDYLIAPDALVDYLAVALEGVIPDKEESYPEEFSWDWDN